MDTFLLEWAGLTRESALLLIPVVAFAEACVGIGLFVSGFIVLILATTFYSLHLVNLTEISVLAFLGAAAGDHTGYWCGRLLGPRLHHALRQPRTAALAERADALIRRHGGAAIVIGRFFPAVRSIVPALVGLSGYPPLKYSLLDLVTCMVWGPALAALVALGAQAF